MNGLILNNYICDSIHLHLTINTTTELLGGGGVYHIMVLSVKDLIGNESSHSIFHS